jgi:hypothetical protein
MKAIADTMDVARSHLIERMKAGDKPARCRYNKMDDTWLLPLIRELVDGRITYGYRRICALLNRNSVRWGSLPSITNGSIASCARMGCC